MKITKTLQSIFLLTAIGALVTFSSCKKDDDPIPAPTPTPTPTVAGYVTNDTSFSILLAAVKKAGLDGALNDATKTWTVFAPTNAAFRAIGYSVTSVNAITTPADITALGDILKYHVLTTKVTSGAVPASDAVATLNGKNLFASRNTNGVFLNGVKVVAADVAASNGVIHAIGKVLIPPTKTIAEIVIDGANFSLLERAVITANLAATLSGPGKFTVFAPVNAGFPAAYDTEAEINAAAPAALAGIVTSHAFNTNIAAGDLVAGNTPSTINPATTLTISLASGPTVKITGSANAASVISATDIIATNGIIHVIEKLLQ
jgi:uncharacterized surface protein with fasciclin (FAS1) repeats